VRRGCEVPKGMSIGKALQIAMDAAARGDFDEVTVGGTLNRRVTPRISGAARVDRFKSAMGVCPVPGCVKIAGHSSPHSK
jgi:hypothetical protein